MLACGSRRTEDGGRRSEGEETGMVGRLDGRMEVVIRGADAVRPALGCDDDHRLFLILGGAFLPSQLQGGQRRREASTP